MSNINPIENADFTEAYNKKINGVMTEFSRITTLPVAQDDKAGFYSVTLETDESRRKLASLSDDFLISAVKSTAPLSEEIHSIAESIQLELSFLEKGKDWKKKIALLETAARALTAISTIAIFIDWVSRHPPENGAGHSPQP